MSVHCDECRDWRTHIDRRLLSITALLRLSVIHRGGVRLGLALLNLSPISLFTIDTEVPSIDEPIPSVQVPEAPSAEASLSDLTSTVLNNLHHHYFLKCVSYLIGGFTPPIQSTNSG